MQDDFIPFIQPTPEPQQTHCKVLVRLIAYTLSYGAFILPLIVWSMTDIVYALGTLIVSYLVIGIIRSKLRNSSIPLEQQEYNYTDHAIAAWFVSRNLLCDYTSDT
jgi:hypothetical protein